MNSTSRESLHSFRTNVPGNNMNPSVLHTGMDKIAKSNQSRKGDLNANQLWGSLTRSVINFAFFFLVVKLMSIRNIKLTKPQPSARLQLSIFTSVINTSGLTGQLKNYQIAQSVVSLECDVKDFFDLLFLGLKWIGIYSIFANSQHLFNLEQQLVSYKNEMGRAK